MTLNEFQKLLAPHTLVSLWAGPSLMLWGGEIEACDFTRYGNRETITAAFWYTCGLAGSSAHPTYKSEPDWRVWGA